VVIELLHECVIIFRSIYLNNLPHDSQALCFISVFTVYLRTVSVDNIVSNNGLINE
jgi:hypothetical protein